MFLMLHNLSRAGGQDEPVVIMGAKRMAVQVPL